MMKDEENRNAQRATFQLSDYPRTRRLSECSGNNFYSRRTARIKHQTILRIGFSMNTFYDYALSDLITPIQSSLLIILGTG